MDYSDETRALLLDPMLAAERDEWLVQLHAVASAVQQKLRYAVQSAQPPRKASRAAPALGRSVVLYAIALMNCKLRTYGALASYEVSLTVGCPRAEAPQSKSGDENHGALHGAGAARGQLKTGGGGDGNGGGDGLGGWLRASRGPQSVQSEPHVHAPNSAPGPPSSQKPSSE